MDQDFRLNLSVAGGAALASPRGGLIAVLVPTSTLFLSNAVGFGGWVHL